MANVAILIRALKIGGAEKQSLLLAKALQSDHQVFLVVQKDSPKAQKHLDYIEVENISYLQLDGNFFKRLLQLSRFVKQKRIQILFAYLTLDNILAAAIRILNPSLRIAGGIRNCLLPKKKFLITKLLHKWLHHYTIFNNQAGMDDFIKKGYNASKSFVIHNCIDKLLDYRPAEQSQEISIISVGRFTESKDFKTALKAIKQLNDMLEAPYKVKYYLIGYGELEQSIRSWVEELELSNVELVIMPNNLNDYYQNADIYLCSSIFEGMPNTIMEAMNHSTPIVSTDIGDNHLLVVDGQTGYLCPEGTPEQLAQKMLLLVVNKEERIDMGKNANALLKSKHSLEQFRTKYNTFIQKALSK